MIQQHNGFSLKLKSSVLLQKNRLQSMICGEFCAGKVHHKMMTQDLKKKWFQIFIRDINCI